MRLSRWFAIVIVSSLLILGTSRFTFAVGPSKILFDFASQTDLSNIQANSSTISVASADGGHVLSLMSEPGKQYPGVALKPENGSWDLSGFKSIVATITNPGTDILGVAMRADNDDPNEKLPFSVDRLDIQPGETRTLQVVFGNSYGKAGYRLDPSKITGLVIYLGGPQPVSQTVLIRKIEAFARIQPPSAPPDFKPNMTGLVMWLDASAEQTLQTDASGKVIRWIDRTGQHHDATPLPGVDAPTRVEDGMNHRPVIHFNGNQALAMVDAIRKQNGQCTVVIAWQQGRGRKANTHPTLFTSQPDPRKKVDQLPNFAMDAGRTERWRAVDFVEQSNIPIGPITIGSSSGDGLLDDVGEVLVYDRAFLSAGERGITSDYLATKWGGIAAKTGWTRNSDLGVPPQRMTDSLPLSDQANKGQWSLDPAFSDEFEGPLLDQKKWHAYNPDEHNDWLGRNPALFLARNVEQKDGQLQLNFRKEDVPEMKDHKGYAGYTSAYCTTRERTGFGYYEINACPMPSAASSSFWLSDSAEPQYGEELDIFELGARGRGFERAYNMTIHVWGVPGDKRHWATGDVWRAPWNIGDAFHTYGFDWNKEQLVWYVDGVPVHSAKNTNWFWPQRLIFDSEAMWSWFGKPIDADLPSTFKINYVRVWRQAVGTPPLLVNNTN